jgi:SAM-dependent methyltransferase
MSVVMKKILISLLVIIVVGCTSQSSKPLTDAEKEIIKNTDKYLAAIDDSDSKTIDLLTLDNFVTILPGGELVTKSTLIKSCQPRTGSALQGVPKRNWQDFTIRFFNDAVLVSGVMEVNREGNPQPLRLFRTLTWIHQGDSWRLACDQSTPALKHEDAQIWNEIYLGYIRKAFNPKPNAFLVEAIKGIRPGKALDVGMGQGRNSVYLATQGWDVTGFDPAEAGLAIARQLASKARVIITPILMGMEDFAWGKDRWDLIALIYVPFRGYINEIRAALKPGGIVVVEAFHHDASQDRKIGGGVVFDKGQLRELFAEGFEIVRYEEPVAMADFGMEPMRLVRLVARKK